MLYVVVSRVSCSLYYCSFVVVVVKVLFVFEEVVVGVMMVA